jgi:hypothetical protein
MFRLLARFRRIVHQCRTFSGGTWSGDLCPRDGGLDQNICGDLTP